jgi:hypothetical protein
MGRKRREEGETRKPCRKSYASEGCEYTFTAAWSELPRGEEEEGGGGRRRS